MLSASLDRNMLNLMTSTNDDLSNGELISKIHQLHIVGLQSLQSQELQKVLYFYRHHI